MLVNRAYISILFLALIVSGCGFQPLYSPKSFDMKEELSHIKITQIKERIGQVMRNELLNLMTPQGQPASPRYTLSVNLNTVKTETAVRKDGTTQRNTTTVTANVQLYSNDLHEMIYTDQFIQTSAYSVGENTAVSAFPLIVSDEYAESNIVKALAQEIAFAISSYLKEHKDPKIMDSQK